MLGDGFFGGGENVAAEPGAFNLGKDPDAHEHTGEDGNASDGADEFEHAQDELEVRGRLRELVLLRCAGVRRVHWGDYTGGVRQGEIVVAWVMSGKLPDSV